MSANVEAATAEDLNEKGSQAAGDAHATHREVLRTLLPFLAKAEVCT